MLAVQLCLPQSDFAFHATRISTAKPEPAIVGAIKTIEADRIGQTIKMQVRFRTRNTLSSMEANLPPSQGINAAADRIAEQFEEISRQCGGCLEVHRDVFFVNPTEDGPWADRIPRPARITNVYGILWGTDPIQSMRIYLVTGHHDSWNSNLRTAGARRRARTTTPRASLYRWPVCAP